MISNNGVSKNYELTSESEHVVANFLDCGIHLRFTGCWIRCIERITEIIAIEEESELLGDSRPNFKT